MMTDDRASVEGERLLDSFVKLYDTGAQGCEMDYETAQALALAIKGVIADLASCERALQRRTDERNNFAAQICEAARTPEPSARGEADERARHPIEMLRSMVAADIARESATASFMIRAGLLADLLDELVDLRATPPPPAVLAEREALKRAPLAIRAACIECGLSEDQAEEVCSASLHAMHYEAAIRARTISEEG